MNDFRHSSTKCYPGQRFGNYVLIRLLGKGGFAEVYLGKHIYLGTRAAVKILHAELANVDMQAFSEEARIAARLVHPHIVRVLEFGMEGQAPFLVMDYAPNGTLRQHYPRGSQLVPIAILKYMRQVADAVQHIHDKGLIHQDIKPENLLIGHRNELWLSDFGIAIAAHKTAVGEHVGVGTIAYMAPEQLEGYPCLASDQYALGIVVYEWLGGTTPFHGSIDEIIHQHFFVRPPSLCASVPIVPSVVEDVVFKALAKDPQQRFESVQAFAEALQNAFEPRPILLRANSRSPRPAPANAPVPAVDKPGREKFGNNKGKKKSTWKEIAACFAIDLLVGIALACVLALLNVASLPLEAFLALCMVLLPLGWALVRDNRSLFFLTCNLVVAAAVAALISHIFALFLVTYIGLLLLSTLTAFAVSLQGP